MTVEEWPTSVETAVSASTESQRPGLEFAQAVLDNGVKAALEFDETITETIVSTRRKPRWPVRNLFHITWVTDGVRHFWSETRHESKVASTVFESDLRPEAAVAFTAGDLPDLRPTTAWIQVPREILDDPAALEHFFNYRVVIRLATAENQALTCGPAGLLNLEEIQTLEKKLGFASPLLAACDAIDQMGCTADGLIINPADYWRLVGSTNIIGILEDHGLRIARTRMLPPGVAIIGDFAQGARLLDANRTVVAFADAPNGTFAAPGLALKAEIYERLLMHLPAVFCRVQLGE